MSLNLLRAALSLLLLQTFAGSIAWADGNTNHTSKATAPQGVGRAPSEEQLTNARNNLIDKLLPQRGITDKKVLEAMRAVPRHKFVPKGHELESYHFGNIDIGSGQVIGDPYIVAFMTQSLETKPNDTILEIGTGSGFQAAVLARLVKKVYSIEIDKALEKTGKKRLADLGFKNVEVKLGDGYRGWPAHAPFDAIIVTSFPDKIPPALIKQLKPGGHMVLPVGGKVQRMKRVSRSAAGLEIEDLNPSGLVITMPDK